MQIPYNDRDACERVEISERFACGGSSGGAAALLAWEVEGAAAAAEALLTWEVEEVAAAALLAWKVKEATAAMWLRRRRQCLPGELGGSGGVRSVCR
jgi:hypothetical protein